MRVEKVYLLAWLFYLEFQKHFRLPFTIELAAATRTEIEIFFGLFMVELEKMRAICAEEVAVANTFAYRFTHLQSRPILKLRDGGKDFLVCPIPSLLPRRLYGGLYYELINCRGFGDAYGKAFQALAYSYVKWRSKDFVVLGEEKYGKPEKRTCDLIIYDNAVNAIFVECKAKRLTEPSKAAVDFSGALSTDLDSLAIAAVQLLKSIEAYEEGEYPQFLFKKGISIHPCVVAIDELYLVGTHVQPELERRITRLAEKELKRPAEVVAGKRRVHLMSVREFESCCAVLASNGAHDVFEKRAQTKYNGWGFGQFLRDGFGEHARSDLSFYRDVAGEWEKTILSP
jgi:hypothetical protein